MSNKIKCSNLNKRIAVEIAQYIKDEVGGATKIWKQNCTLWGALMKHKKGIITKGIIQEQNVYTIVFRYAKEIFMILESVQKPQFKSVRFEHNGKIFTPSSMVSDMREKYIMINAVEG